MSQDLETIFIALPLIFGAWLTFTVAKHGAEGVTLLFVSVVGALSLAAGAEGYLVLLSYAAPYFPASRPDWLLALCGLVLSAVTIALVSFALIPLVLRREERSAT